MAGVFSISSTTSAFAALKGDGTGVTWGYGAYGGGSAAVRALLVDVQHVYATRYSFAALKADGSMTTWGSKVNGGGSNKRERMERSRTFEQLTDVQHIYATMSAFAAMKSDSTVATWER